MSKTYKVVSPFDQKEIYSFEYTTKFNALKSINILEQKNFNNLSSQFSRSNVLRKLSELITDNFEVISKLITLETGKVIKDSRAEVKRAITLLGCSSDYIRTHQGELLNSSQYSDTHKWGIVEKVPLGIILCITPFNFPINLAIHKIAPAFAMGNAILLKPHPQCFQSTKLLIDLCYKSGMLASDIQFICPDVPEFQEIINHESIAMLSFTGGDKTARAISSSLVLKKQLYELGGNCSIAVFADADIEKAAQTCIHQRFGCAGQRCTAIKRAFIHKDVYEKFKQTLLSQAKLLKVGDPLNDSSDIGPVISIEQAKLLESIIGELRDSGGRILLGGKREDAIIEPTIIEGIDHEHQLIKDEIFGPILPIFKFETDDELIRAINSTNYGLQCGLFTDDLSKVKNLFKNIDVGSVVINEGPAFRSDHFPFGGVKSSGVGREGIKYAMEEMSTTKTLIL